MERHGLLYASFFFYLLRCRYDMLLFSFFLTHLLTYVVCSVTVRSFIYFLRHRGYVWR